jgi:hypothetical protein
MILRESDKVDVVQNSLEHSGHAQEAIMGHSSMEQLGKLAQRFFSLRNLAPALMIVVAIIGSLGLKPFGLGFTTEQVILALLAFLAIDALVERLDILTNIEENVSKIVRSLAPKASANVFFRKRINYPRLELLVRDARDEIWIAGVTLDTIVTLAGALEAKVAQGCKIRILALSPKGSAFQIAANYFLINPALATTRINSNLAAIARKIRSPDKGHAEIRVIDAVFPTGYFAIDPKSPKGKMIVQLYLYRIRTEEAPLFEVSEEEDSEWYTIFLRQFEEGWNSAIAFEA